MPPRAHLCDPQTWNCPVAPVGPALSPIYGEFGTTGNLTIPLYKGEDFMIICPVDGHCE